MPQLGVRLSSPVLAKLFTYASAVQMPKEMGHLPKSKKLAQIQTDLVEIGQRIFYNSFDVQAQFGGLVANISGDDITKPLFMAEMLDLSFSLANDLSQLRLKGTLAGMRVLDCAPDRSLYRDIVLGGPFRQGGILCDSDSDVPLARMPRTAGMVPEEDCMLLFDINLPMAQNRVNDLTQETSITIQLQGFHSFVLGTTMSDWLLLACRYVDAGNFLENVPKIMKLGALVLGDNNKVLPGTKMPKLALLVNDFKVYLPKHSKSHEAVEISFSKLTARTSRVGNVAEGAKHRLSTLDQKLIVNLIDAKITTVGHKRGKESSEIDTVLQVNATDRAPKTLRTLWKGLVDRGGLRSGRIFRVSPDPHLKEQTRAELAELDYLPAEDLAPLITDAHVAASLIKDYFNTMKPKLLDELREDTLLELCEMTINEFKLKLPEKLHPKRLELLEWLLDRCNELVHGTSSLDIHSMPVIIAPVLFSDRALWSKHGYGVAFLKKALYCRHPRDEGVIPKQLRALWQCLLADNGLGIEGIFRVPASSLEASATQDAMTHAYHASLWKLASMCPNALCASSLIKRYFRYLKPRMFESFDEKTLVEMTNMKKSELFATLEFELSNERMALLRWLLDCCVAVVYCKNNMTIDAVATVFAPNLFSDEQIQFAIKEGQAFLAHVISEHARDGLNQSHVIQDFPDSEDENQSLSTILRVPSVKCTLGRDKSLLAIDLHIKPVVFKLEPVQARLIYCLYENLFEQPQQPYSEDTPLGLLHLLQKPSQTKKDKPAKPRDLMLKVNFEGAQIFYSAPVQQYTDTRSKTPGHNTVNVPMMLSKIGKITARFSRDRKSVDAAVTLKSLCIQDRRPNVLGTTQTVLLTDASEQFLRAKICAKFRSRRTRRLESLSVKGQIQPLNLLVNDLLVHVTTSLANSQPKTLPELPRHLAAFWRAAGKQMTIGENKKKGAPLVLATKDTGLNKLIGDSKDPFKVLGRVEIDVDLNRCNLCILRDLQQQTRDKDCISLQWRRIAIGGSSTRLDDAKYLVGIDHLRLCLLAVGHDLTVTRSAQVENGAALNSSMRASLSQDLLQPLSLTLKAKSSLARWANTPADDAKQKFNAEDTGQLHAVLQLAVDVDPVRMSVSDLVLEQITDLAAQIKFVLGRLKNPYAQFKKLKSVIRTALQKRKTSTKLLAIKRWILETVPLDLSFSMLDCDLYAILPAADMCLETVLRVKGLRAGLQTDGRSAEMQLGKL